MDSDEMGKKSIKKKNLYSRRMQILLVGEGDFSFALCLAKRFGSANNITATTLDTREEMELNYRHAKANVDELEDLGCRVLYGVNVHSMDRHHRLRHQIFDRTVFNFPHAGYQDLARDTDSRTISRHQDLVRGFFRSAREMVGLHGEIHVTHKTAYPFSAWDLETLAERQGLYLVGEVPFCREGYPGYTNKRGGGVRCDSTFPIGEASTFRFKTSTLR